MTQFERDLFAAYDILFIMAGTAFNVTTLVDIKGKVNKSDFRMTFIICKIDARRKRGVLSESANDFI